MKKSKFNLTHLHSTTLDPGYLVPFLMLPTLPNDTFRLGLSSFIRAQPMLAPLMHEVRLFTQYWFVPNRLVWDDWEEFITGGQDLMSTPPFPTVTLGADDAKVGSLTDYFGFPLVEGIEVSALPYRAMAEIWNARYRDEDLQQPVSIDYGSGEDTNTSRALLSPAFSKDYFTTARPWTQRGGDIIVPVSDAVATGTNSGKKINFVILFGSMTATETATGNAALTTCGSNVTIADITFAASSWIKARVEDGTIDGLIYDIPDNPNQMTVEDFNAHKVIDLNRSTYGTGRVIFSVWVFPTSVEDINSNSPIGSSFDVSFQANFSCPPIWYWAGTSGSWSLSGGGTARVRFVNISNGLIVNAVGEQRAFSQAFTNGSAVVPLTQSVSGFTIRDLRTSSALQRYAERSLKWGNRYEEFIMREFGIKPRDARIQRPEYLGGGSGILSISEVLQTAESTDTGVGTMRGHGVASISQRPIRFRCPEHGIILGLMSIRPKSVYTQGIDREWLKRSRLDFFTPELASIGMQEVLQQELFATPDNASAVFGYSERYQEYRYQKPLVTSEFRTNLNFWNMARIFQNAPELTPEFISMAYSVDDFKRPFQVQDDGAHSFVAMLKNHVRAYRPIPKRAKDVLR